MLNYLAICAIANYYNFLFLNSKSINDYLKGLLKKSILIEKNLITTYSFNMLFIPDIV